MLVMVGRECCGFRGAVARPWGGGAAPLKMLLVKKSHSLCFAAYKTIPLSPKTERISFRWQISKHHALAFT